MIKLDILTLTPLLKMVPARLGDQDIVESGMYAHTCHKLPVCRQQSAKMAYAGTQTASANDIIQPMRSAHAGNT